MRNLMALGLAAGLALAGCQQYTAYQPMAFNGGYTDEQLSADSYKIHVAGNEITGAGRVQAIAFLRASDLTLNAGYKRFVVVSNDIVERATLFSLPLKPGETQVERVSRRKVSKPSGDFVIRFVRPDDPAYATAFDAAEEAARIRPEFSPSHPPPPGTFPTVDHPPPPNPPIMAPVIAQGTNR